VAAPVGAAQPTATSNAAASDRRSNDEIPMRCAHDDELSLIIAAHPESLAES
jgi:hypothetical protein